MIQPCFENFVRIKFYSRFIYDRIGIYLKQRDDYYFQLHDPRDENNSGISIFFNSVMNN